VKPKPYRRYRFPQRYTRFAWRRSILRNETLSGPAHLIPVLEAMLEQFPFRIHSFHSDNGGEFINHTVAKLLNKLLIEQTESRPRHSNDNGLVECKNGAVVRKHMGYTHIATPHAEAGFGERGASPDREHGGGRNAKSQTGPIHPFPSEAECMTNPRQRLSSMEKARCRGDQNQTCQTPERSPTFKNNGAV
jgi:transposase InsO family protein